jgi:hypothetical protein
MISIRLDELATDGEAGQLLEEETPRAAAGERKLADQLLVSGLLARGGGDSSEQLAIGHMPRLSQVESYRDFGVRRLHRKHRVAVEWVCASSWRSRKIDSTDFRPRARWPRRRLR